MSCFFKSDNSLVMRRGDTAKITIESDDIPFEEYAYAYFAIIDLETLLPVLPELKVPTTNVRAVQFVFTAEQTDTLPQPTEEYDVYGYTFKLCASDGTEDTYIPEVVVCCDGNITMKRIPKVLLYPKVNEGDVPNEIEE